MKYKIWYAPMDGGDGSAFVCFFKTKEDAEEYIAHDFERSGCGWAEDCIDSTEFEFDENGNFLNPDKIC